MVVSNPELQVIIQNGLMFLDDNYYKYLTNKCIWVVTWICLSSFDFKPCSTSLCRLTRPLGLYWHPHYSLQLRRWPAWWQPLFASLLCCYSRPRWLHPAAITQWCRAKPTRYKRQNVSIIHKVTILDTNCCAPVIVFIISF